MPTEFEIEPQERFARQVVRTLSDAGHVAYFAGGCVRDRLFGRKPKDFDVATDATPDRIREVFGNRRTLPIGAAFGVISVLGERGRGDEPVEVATFRSDGSYSDGRRPDSVVFSSPEEDALRRDFTINGLFYDPISESVIDFVGGTEDLANGTIRAIGDPNDRISEDKLRMLRAVRFAAVFDFEIEQKTFAAVSAHASGILLVSGERIGAEMRRLLSSEHAFRGLDLLVATQLAEAIYPELYDAWTHGGCEQQCDRWNIEGEGSSMIQRLLSARSARDFVSGLVATLLGIELTGSDRARSLRSVGAKWRLSNEEIAICDAALSSHLELLDAHKLPWSRVQPQLIRRYASESVQFARSMSDAFGIDGAGVSLCESRLQWDCEQLNPEYLVTGDTLQSMGLQAGPLFKEIIETVRAQQLDGLLSNVEAAKRFVQQQYIDP